jgi:hypothetical protein
MAGPAAELCRSVVEEVRVDERRRLLAAIDEAFCGVQLGDGVSLHETVLADNYGTEEQRRAAREPDEKHDWRRLASDPDLRRIAGVGGLSFYDAAGLRFHLPAYLSLAVTDFESDGAGNVLESLMFTLTHFSEHNAGRLSILTPAQRECVREVLLFLRREYELDDPHLDRAISGSWGAAPAR